MRIVGGAWRGRRLDAPRGEATRPTSDRVREALFDALAARLGADLGGGRVLDLYAGTGALGLEALSRGASFAVLVERDRDALAALAGNIARMGAHERCETVAADADGAGLTRASALGPYALLLVDPPYRIEQSSVASAVECLDSAGALDREVIVAYEHACATTVTAPAGFAVLRVYTHGDTAVTVLRRSGGHA